MHSTLEKPDEPSPTPARLPTQVADSLFRSRTVLVFGEISATLAQHVVAQLLALSAESHDPIRVVINSQGGHVEAGDTIHDVIRFIRPPVRMIGTGWVVSAGALIYAAAAPDQRVCLPNTRFMLHQPLGGVGGPASDVEIEAAQIIAMRERLNHTFARATGQPYEKIARDTERNFWMTASEARAYGLVSRIIDTPGDF